MSNIFDISAIGRSNQQNRATSPVAAQPGPYSQLQQYGSNNVSLNADGNTTGLVPQDKGFSFGDWAKVGQGVANTYLGAEALQLGKDHFGFAKDSFNTNLANQAQLINNEMESRQRARLETSGQYTGEGGQASLQSDLQSYLKPRQVSGEAI